MGHGCALALAVVRRGPSWSDQEIKSAQVRQEAIRLPPAYDD